MLSNLPPGVTESMIPGCGFDEIVEIPEPDPTDDSFPLDEWHCDDCNSPIGWVLWETDDNMGMGWSLFYEVHQTRNVCEDCVAALLDAEI